MKVISEAERRAGRDDVSRRSFSEGRSFDELFVTKRGNPILLRLDGIACVSSIMRLANIQRYKLKHNR